MSSLTALLITGLALSTGIVPPPREPTLNAVSGPPRPASAASDTLEAVEHVDFVLSQYYRRVPGWSTRGDRRARDDLGQPFDRRCDGERDDVCFAGDPDAGRCPNFVQCHPSQKRVLETLVEATHDHPESGYLAGQAVYLLGKFDRFREAMGVVDACRAETWWCDALRGYVLHGMAEDALADATLRRALDQAPDSVRCALTDATWVLGRWSQRGSNNSVPEARTDREEWDCRRRMAVSDTIWWLSDPLYGTPGNERWVEHVTRSMSARFHAEIRNTIPGSQGPERYQDHLWASRVRRGPVDSYDSDRGLSWTSRAAAAYHFVPDFEADDLGDPIWKLDGDLDDEGYTPAVRGPFMDVPYQVARFRTGESMRVVAATRLKGTPLVGALDAAATFVLTDGPERMPLRLVADGHLSRPQFSGRAPSEHYIASLEVVTSKGVGWARAPLGPLVVEGAEISDMLLYAPEGDAEPNDTASAVDAMLGSTALQEEATVGIFWETYQAPAGATLEFHLSIEKSSGGLIDRLRRRLPGGTPSDRGTLTWTEPVSGDTHPTAISLDLRDLGKGEYAFVLRVGWEGRSVLERRRAFTVE